MKRKFIHLFSAISLCLLLGCGGGGGSDEPAPPATPPPVADNNWDSLVWDQGEWQ